jgi:hypothetical protein
MEIGVQIFNKVSQTVIGGFQRYYTARYEIIGGDCTLIELLGANGRRRKCAQIGGKIQSRTSNAAGFTILSG